MAQRTSLSEAQVELLRWIGAGCPPGIYEGTHHRISVAALTRRGLVVARGHGPTWTATLTSAGRSYLDQVEGSNPPLPRQANVSVTEQLVADVIEAGGTLQVPRHTPGPGRVDWENRVRQAMRRGKVPPGKQLTYIYVRDKSTDEIRLIDAPEGTELILLPVPVPERVARYHPTVPTFRKNVARLEMSDAALPRASRILQALVVESEARGLTVTAGAPATKRSASSGWSAPTDGHIALEAPGATVRLPCSTPCRPRAGPPPSPSPHDRVANDGRPRLAGNTWANMTWGNSPSTPIAKQYPGDHEHSATPRASAANGGFVCHAIDSLGTTCPTRSLIHSRLAWVWRGIRASRCGRSLGFDRARPSFETPGRCCWMSGFNKMTSRAE